MQAFTFANVCINKDIMEKTAGNVTIIDVAREAGVSYTTVSRVINNSKHVKPRTRERVLQVMESLGYEVNRQARSLAGGHSNIVGLLVPDLSTGYIGEIVRGIGDELNMSQYDLMLYTTHLRQAKESNYVVSLARGTVDGLLLVLPRNPGAYFEILHRQNIPYILIDHQGIGEANAAVGATNQQGAYEATRYLLQLGHRRIGFVTGTMEMGCAQERLAGYRQALAEHGVAADPQLVREGDFHQPRGFTAGLELLSSPVPPTAIFASNDVSAFGVMEATREKGLRIPDDISVMGFDDIPQAGHVRPMLTTVRQPLEEMGRTAARLLLECIKNPGHIAKRVELPTSLVVRESCRALEIL
jgi:LacI family transcriptional regulator